MLNFVLLYLIAILIFIFELSKYLGKKYKLIYYFSFCGRF
jgi:hypothetical protein